MVEVWKSNLIVCGLNALAMGVLSYHCLRRREIVMAAASAVIFLASIAVFAYSVYRLSRK